MLRYNPLKPLYFGHELKTERHQKFMSGGAGYVLSKEALRRLATIGSKNATLCRHWGGAEDVALSTCLQNLGVQNITSLDARGSERFNVFNLETSIFGKYPEWYYKYSTRNVTWVIIILHIIQDNVPKGTGPTK